MRSLLAVLLVIMTIGACNVPPEKKLEKLATRLSSHSSVHFKAVEKFVYLGQTDTLQTDYEAWLVRTPEDTVLGGYAWVDNKYRPYSLVYNFQKGLYAVYPTKHRIRFYPKVDPVLIGYGDWINFFFHPMDLVTRESGFDEFVVEDTIIDGHKYLLLRTQKNTKKRTIIVSYIIDTSTGFPIKSIAEVRKAKRSYRDELDFTYVQFEPVDTVALNKKLKGYLSKYPKLTFDEGSDAQLLANMLEIGASAPEIKGSFYRTGEPFSLSDYIGKNVILVEFWYTHCPYCAMSIPYLAELYNEKKDQGLTVFGINSIDNKPGMTDKVLKFCQNRKMTYEPIRTTQATDREYKVVGYPTIYLIDRQGRIAYKDIGFSMKRYERLRRAVDSLLSRRAGK